MTRHEQPFADEQARAVAEYKTILRNVIETRPSGTRQRLATSLGKNRSFISQIANPQYSTPIPASHLNAIFETCHFPPARRDQFLAAYDRAHPCRLAELAGGTKLRRHTSLLPDLGSPKRNAQLDELVADFVRKLAKIIHDNPKTSQ